jgi:predicted AAA+ superfamily ATPase
MEIDRLTRFNEWWWTNRVKPSLLKPHKRPLFFRIQRYMQDRQILLITGLRRVGKTTLLYQLIQDLLDKKVKAEKIIYFSFDEAVTDFEDLTKTYEEKVLKKKIEDEKIYIFLDEVQKCKNWQNKIKIFYDLYPNMKFIISGSASVQISKRAKESLAGRIFDFLLEPLSFKEFLEWKNVKIDKGKIELFQREAAPLFYDYLRKGGFPEIVDEEEDEKIRGYIKNNVIESIVYKDLPEEFGIRDYELLKTLVGMIATQPGTIINYDALSRDLHKNKKTIIDYLFYLEYALLVRVVANYRKGFLVSSRKMRKAYIANTAISFALVENFYSSVFLEKIAENFAIIETDAKNYYRNKYEVDIILREGGEIIPVEVKYGKVEIDSILRFLSEFKLKNALVLTKDVFDKKIVNKNRIVILPLWAFALTKEEYMKVATG